MKLPPVIKVYQNIENGKFISQFTFNKLRWPTAEMDTAELARKASIDFWNRRLK